MKTSEEIVAEIERRINDSQRDMAIYRHNTEIQFKSTIISDEFSRLVEWITG